MTRPKQQPQRTAEGGSTGSLIRCDLLQRLQRTLRVEPSVSSARALSAVRAELARDDVASAVRWLDHAWRCYPRDAAMIAALYARGLMLQGSDHDAALRMLARADAERSDPDIAGLIALVHLRRRQPEEACAMLRRALTEFCVAPAGLLYAIAGEITQDPTVAAATPGWIGRGPTLELIGELHAQERAHRLEIQLDDELTLTRMLPAAADHRRVFQLSSARLRAARHMVASVGGKGLLGGGTRLPADFGLDGRAQLHGHRVQGWARLGWLPRRRLRLRIEDERGRRIAGALARAPDIDDRWPFALDLRAAGLTGERLQISVQLPNNAWRALPDAPLLRPSAVRLKAPSPRLARRRDAAGPRKRALAPAGRTDVIVPVFAGREATLSCLSSVLSSIDESAQLVIVDDASEDSALVAALDALAADARVTLLRNPTNLGFVASVNRATSLHPTHDVVLLNSDTRVFDDWLVRLRRAAYSARSVGTVTPLTNNGTIASYPSSAGSSIDPTEAAAWHALAAATHPDRRVTLPVGVGFCLYIRRECLNDVGALDAAVFGIGYGEETDFCLRARRRGWSHQLAADVFVYHAGALSFGPRRAALLERASRLINIRHPGYDEFIASFMARDPLHAVRRALDEQRVRSLHARWVLIVTLALPGGVAHFVDERCRQLRAQGLTPLLLRPSQPGDPRHCELWTEALSAPNLQYEVPADLAALSGLLRALELVSIELQHFLHLDARVIEAVRSLPTGYRAFVHDYAWVCPRVTLLDGHGRYCGEPAIRACESCVRRHGGKIGERISVAALRRRSQTWLRAARDVVVPSNDTAQRLQRYFPELSIRIEPHAQITGNAHPHSRRHGRIRVALIGAIGEHKGYSVLLRCAQDARTRNLPLEFVVIGFSGDDAPLLRTDHVFVTGRYSESELPHLLRREQPDIAWFASVAPETWCYTLDHALAAGLPIMAFDLGAIAERLRTLGLGTLLPTDTHPQRINDQLLALTRRNPAADWAPDTLQTSKIPSSNEANIMATQPIETHMTNGNEARPAAQGQGHDERLSASIQVLPLPPGLYLFSAHSNHAEITRPQGRLSLPAVQVGLGPGMSSAQVEFISGPTTQSNWLFATGDVLIAKVHASGATLILTSVRGPGGEALDIGVERLETRAYSLASNTPAPVPPADTALPAPAVMRPPRDPSLPLPLQIGAHIRRRGDMSFVDAPWAGRVGAGLWIESFSVRPLEHFGPADIEYKGLTGSGFETPWLSDEKMCGTKGMATPLVGFAVRLKPSSATASYDCEYSGYFQSGVVVGPLRNGAPCRSTVANDPLEGIQIRLLTRAAATPATLSNGKPSSAPVSDAGTSNEAVPRTGRRLATRRS